MADFSNEFANKLMGERRRTQNTDRTRRWRARNERSDPESFDVEAEPKQQSKESKQQDEAPTAEQAEPVRRHFLGSGREIFCVWQCFLSVKNERLLP